MKRAPTHPHLDQGAVMSSLIMSALFVFVRIKMVCLINNSLSIFSFLMRICHKSKSKVNLDRPSLTFGECRHLSTLHLQGSLDYQRYPHVNNIISHTGHSLFSSNSNLSNCVESPPLTHWSAYRILGASYCTLIEQTTLYTTPVHVTVGQKLCVQANW